LTPYQILNNEENRLPTGRIVGLGNPNGLIKNENSRKKLGPTPLNGSSLLKDI
jgi:hypothetical protein